MNKIKEEWAGMMLFFVVGLPLMLVGACAYMIMTGTMVISGGDCHES